MEMVMLWVIESFKRCLLDSLAKTEQSDEVFGNVK
jgi:hypothetical protein